MKTPSNSVASQVEAFHQFLKEFTETPRDAMELKLYLRALKELRAAHNMFSKFKGRRKVSIFGSARTGPEHHSYQHAVGFAELMTANEWCVITGAGPGIMQAGHQGAEPENRIGLNISLPFEQGANSLIEGSDSLATMRFFFTRKLMFIAKSDAIVAFNGGFGTFDELFEALTLVQTGKSPIVPICLIDSPGKSFFKDLDAFIRNQLLAERVISPEDTSLYLLTDDVNVAAKHILEFYSVYHSIYYVRDLTILRLNEKLSQEKIEELNEKFGNILKYGKIEYSESPQDEHYVEEHKGKPRLMFAFNMRSFSKLRQLIDCINKK